MKKLELFKACASDYVDELNKLKIGNHKFQISKKWIHVRGRRFSYINITCSQCGLKNSLNITDDIDALIIRRDGIATDTGKNIQSLIKTSLFIINNEQCFTDAVYCLTCEERIIKSIIE